MKNKRKQNSKGITLIALVITIIVLLILAGVSISLVVGDNGILKKSQSAKVETEIAEEKEIIANAVAQVKMGKPFESIEENEFRNALSQNSPSNNKATLEDADEEKFIVYFAKNERVYYVYYNENINYIGQSTGLKSITVSCVNKDVNGNTVREFPEKTTVYKTLSSKYSIVPPQIEGYVPESEAITGETAEDKEITVEYYKILTEDDLVFTSYTDGGEEKYKLSGLNNNSKTIKSVLNVPQKYNEKNVTKIGNNAFANIRNIFKVDIPDTIEEIEMSAFSCCTNLEYVNLNAEKLPSFYAFDNCSKLKKLDIGANVKSIAQLNFRSCSKLNDLTLYSSEVILNNSQFRK